MEETRRGRNLRKNKKSKGPRLTFLGRGKTRDSLAGRTGETGRDKTRAQGPGVEKKRGAQMGGLKVRIEFVPAEEEFGHEL